MSCLPRRAGPAGWLASPAALSGLLAAAVLGAAIGVIAGCERRSAEPSEPRPPAAPLVPVAPSGVVGRPFAFEWQGAGPDAVYHVSVFDLAERQLFAWDTRSAHVDPPPDLNPYFRDGGSFLWKVAVVDSGGQYLRESPLTRFSVER